MGAKYDFSGWATKNDLLCSDGRTIRRDAFKDCDGKTVPLVFQHNHDDIDNVLGHGLLENRKDGVYFYGKFNNTPRGQNAKEMVANGDITHLSIWANKLVQEAGDVMHGVIQEVSLVLAGANPGACIEFPILAHSEEGFIEEDMSCALIYTGESLELTHEDKETDNSKEEKKEDKEMANEDKKERTLEDVYKTLNEEQKQLLHAMVGMAMDDEDDEEDNADQPAAKDEVKHSLEEDENTMKHNVFDGSTEKNTLSHDDMKNFATAVFQDMKKYGSFKESFLAHADDYGIIANPSKWGEYENGGYDAGGIEALFPEFRNLNKESEFLKRDTSWVSEVMSGVHRTPFSRIKTMFADITEDEARAKGYMKGKLKKEEVFSLLKRTTDPQTVYKKQKLDRDDIIDITDFDVVVWLRREMRMMLEEEVARAILIGDGRLNSDDDKISEDHVRSVYNDKELFTIRVQVSEVTSGDDKEDKNAKAIIRSIIKARKQYKGSGNPVFFANEDYITDMLLMEDGIGHTLYPTMDALATKLRVRKIVPVPVMEGIETNGMKLVGVIVNLNDYNVGADKGGEVNMFDDFDIDYNQMKYLIETRISGALTKPYSAMAVEIGTASTPNP